MRFFASLLVLASVAFALPSEIVKRAAPGDVATLGYAAAAGYVLKYF
jgi:hypothetical protein